MLTVIGEKRKEHLYSMTTSKKQSYSWKDFGIEKKIEQIYRLLTHYNIHPK